MNQAAAVLELTEKRTFCARLHDRTLNDLELVSEWEGFAKLQDRASRLHLIVMMSELRIVGGSPALVADLGILPPAAAPGLKTGEVYIGLVRDSKDRPLHHLILLPGEMEGVSWSGAVTRAGSLGGDLPSRQEQRLLFDNAKEQFQPNAYWSNEQHAADADCAWFQYFDDGGQNYNLKSASLRARAVRRLPI